MRPDIHTVDPSAPWAGTFPTPADPRLNALKHGRRAASILLPGEDAAEFNELLQELFEDYRPRTRREIRCVEAIADYEWCLERNGRMRRYYHGKVTALHAGDPAAQPHCEHDPHRWHHSAQDCTREEARLMRLRNAAVEELATLKQLRRQNLLNDAMHALEGPAARPVFSAAHREGAAPAAKAAPAGHPTATPASEAETAAGASSDGENRDFPERTGGQGLPPGQRGAGGNGLWEAIWFPWTAGPHPGTGQAPGAPGAPRQ